MSVCHKNAIAKYVVFLNRNVILRCFILDAAAGYAFHDDKKMNKNCDTTCDKTTGYCKEFFNNEDSNKKFTSMKQCLAICDDRADCKSFEYNDSDGRCRLSSVCDKPSHLDHSGYRFYVKGIFQ